MLWKNRHKFFIDNFLLGKIWNTTLNHYPRIFQLNILNFIKQDWIWQEILNFYHLEKFSIFPREAGRPLNFPPYLYKWLRFLQRDQGFIQAASIPMTPKFGNSLNRPPWNSSYFKAVFFSKSFKTIKDSSDEWFFINMLNILSELKQINNMYINIIVK